MARLFCIVTTSATALTPATAKTVIQLVAPTNQRLRLHRWSLNFDGQNPTDQPVQYRLLRQASAGTMTSATPAKLDTDLSETVQATAATNATAEPTLSAVIDIGTIHPQINGEKIYTWPMDVIVPGGGRLGLEAQAPAAVNVRATMIFEE
jgi:hypothetical protein